MYFPGATKCLLPIEGPAHLAETVFPRVPPPLRFFAQKVQVQIPLILGMLRQAASLLRFE
jgi:hypothetical protein